ncbi:Glycosyl hydrolase, five-bladed beta-propellor domain containing protein [Rhypophila sp. PSN 637]
MFIITIITLLYALLVVGDEVLDFSTYPHGNPFIPVIFGYSDASYYDGKYWVYHANFPQRPNNPYIDAYSSSDLKTWRQYRVLSKDAFAWVPEGKPIMSVTATKAIDGRYYLYFDVAVGDGASATVQIGVGVADRPEGPYTDKLNRALHDTKQSASLGTSGPSVFSDNTGTYLYYINNNRAQFVKLKDGIILFDREPSALDLKTSSQQPAAVFGGLKIFAREGQYYLLYRRDPGSFQIAYAKSSNPTSGFVEEAGNVLVADNALATSFGSATVINVNGTNIWHLVYTRKLSDHGWDDPSMSGLAYDRLFFDGQAIQQITMTMQDDFDNESHDRAIWTEYWAKYITVLNTADEGFFRMAAPFHKGERDYGDGRSMMSTNFKPMANAGVVFRVKNPLMSALSAPEDDFEGYYAGFQINPNKLVVGLVTNGSWSSLREADLGADFNYTQKNRLRVRAEGATIHVAAGPNSDQYLITVTDETFKFGQTGLRTFKINSWFDNLMITPL